MKKCRHCNKQFPDEARFCDVCGKELIEDKEKLVFCPECGEKVSMKYKFCPNCSASLEVDKLSAHILKRRKKKLLPIIVLVFVVVVVGIGVGYLSVHDFFPAFSPKTIKKNNVTSISENEVNEKSKVKQEIHLAVSAFEDGENEDGSISYEWICYGMNGQELFSFPDEQYKFVGSFDENGLAVVIDTAKKCGVINTSGEEILPCQFDKFGIWTEEETSSPIDDFLNLNGIRWSPEYPLNLYKYMGHCLYNYNDYKCSVFDENGLAIVGKKDENSGTGYLCGVIDTSGDVVIPFQYDGITDFSKNGLAMACKRIPSDDKNNGLDYKIVFQCINKAGDIIFELPDYYKGASEFSENGLAQVCVHDPDEEILDDAFLYGYINENGEEVIPCQYPEACGFSPNGLALVDKVDGYGAFIDAQGTERIENIDFDNSNGFSKVGEACVSDGNDTYRYIDSEGQEILSLPYETETGFMTNFYKDIAWFIWIEMNEDDESGMAKSGCIDKNGREIVSKTFSLKSDGDECVVYYGACDNEWITELDFSISDGSNIQKKLIYYDKAGNVQLDLSDKSCLFAGDFTKTIR